MRIPLVNERIPLVTERIEMRIPLVTERIPLVTERIEIEDATRTSRHTHSGVYPLTISGVGHLSSWPSVVLLSFGYIISLRYVRVPVSSAS